MSLLQSSLAHLHPETSGSGGRCNLAWPGRWLSWPAEARFRGAEWARQAGSEAMGRPQVRGTPTAALTANAGYSIAPLRVART